MLILLGCRSENTVTTENNIENIQTYNSLKTPSPTPKQKEDSPKLSNERSSWKDKIGNLMITENEKYRAQKMQLILRVPKGGKVYLDNSLRRFIYDIKNVENIYDSDMLKHRWEMRENGLNCLDCDGTEKTLDGNEYNKSDFSDGGVHISNSGVYIHGSNDEVVSIDSNGIVVRKDGKIKKIKKGDFHIQIDEVKH